MSAPRKCFYEVLHVARDASDADIKKAYRAQALSQHPDKNRGREAAASEEFKLVQHAYSVLSDPHERAWYDSHRTQILRGQEPGRGGSADGPPDPTQASEVDVFACFDAAFYRGFGGGEGGFYAVYARVFERLWEEEREAGEVRSGVQFGVGGEEWGNVRDFYRVWEGFSSRKSFSFADKWNLTEAPNREMRRQMEKENKKERAKMKKEFNATVRELVAFVKKRDPRVTARKKSEVKEREERERKAEEQRKARELQRKDDAAEARAARDEALEEDAEGLDEILAAIALDEKLEKKNRRKKGQRQKDTSGEDNGNSDTENALEREEEGDSIAVEFRDGAEADDDRSAPDVDGDVSSDESGVGDDEDLYCIACKKPFRTVAQKIDHEKSKKHKTAVARLKRQLLKEEKAYIKANGVPPPANGDETLELASSSSKNLDPSLLPGGFQADMTSHNSDPLQTSKSKKKSKRSRAKANPVMLDVPGEDETAELSDSGNLADISESNTEDDKTDMSVVDSAQDDETTVSADEAAVKKPELTKKQKRRLREQKKKEQGAAPAAPTDGVLRCNTCKSQFSSRNKLMRHVENTGHALYVSEKSTRGKGS